MNNTKRVLVAVALAGAALSVSGAAQAQEAGPVDGVTDVVGTTTALTHSAADSLGSKFGEFDWQGSMR
ncbi:hypothetical protein [Streptomyces sp. NPDC002082]|uniref:hypothetical protein n=1 Tax=Streptomyces sp. NPDC002082 TaxID=3154772 RepID=UPI003320564D